MCIMEQPVSTLTRHVGPRNAQPFLRNGIRCEAGSSDFQNRSGFYLIPVDYMSQPRRLRDTHEAVADFHRIEDLASKGRGY